MKTMNTNEDIPKYFYIFTNRNESYLWNQCENYNIKNRGGKLISSGFGNVLCLQEDQKEKFLQGDITYAPFVPNDTTNVGSLSPFLMRLISRYSLEYTLEYIRYQFYKIYPSRFSCIFAFGNLDDCITFSQGKKNWNLKQLKKYKLLYDESYNKYIKVIKTNFKIIGLMEYTPILSFLPDNQEHIGRHYWEGGGELQLPEFVITDDVVRKENKCDNLNEYLIEGILEEVEFNEQEIKKIKGAMEK